MPRSFVIIFPKATTRRKLYKKVETDLGHAFERDGEEDVYYEVAVDWSKLDAMAKQAAGNAGLRSRKGPLQVRVLAKKRVEDKESNA